MKKFRRVVYSVIIFLLIIISGGSYSTVSRFNSRDYIRIRYADWSGWIIETENHLLVFDYVELMPPGRNQLRSIDYGYLTEDYLSDRKVRVFVSHIHGDHYSSIIWDWREYSDDIRYFLGWDYSDEPDVTCFTEVKKKYCEPNLVVYTIRHPTSQVSGVAYLVLVDGIKIYHSGDVASSSPELREDFKIGIDYFKGLVERVDLAFLSKFGGFYGEHTNPLDVYVIKTLNPKVVFPQHVQGGGYEYLLYELELKSQAPNVSFGKAQGRGDVFLYNDGELRHVFMKTNK